MRSSIVVSSLMACLLLATACGGDSEPAAGPTAAADLVANLGCVSCHSINGDRKQGPTWKGLAGAEVELADGSMVRADRAYLTQAIQDPDADVVDGFAPIMPDLGLEPEQIAAIVTYIEELS